MTRRFEFCGAFNGTCSLREGETVEQMRERVEQALLAALDKHCKRLDVNIGVDTDLKETTNGK